ncbi:MAG: DAK2 domain-containing protein [Oscillospiraceae bacterium]|jgi:DAK2 domain fusion protein YloV|nr:DAK2 domain-containing protein [Oscillospiraceae bacterium]
MFISGAAAIENARVAVNELNVFPVPDGDTGINMTLTMKSAVAEMLKHNHQTVGNVAQAAAAGLLRGARGNSGVILSLLFRGLAKSLKDKEKLTGADFGAALSEGVDAAYRAVMKPTEGTMLTVSRMAAARAVITAGNDNTLETVLAEAVLAANEALPETIEQNPVLKKAGVIDAGGKGFAVILEGMLSALQGNPVAVGEAVPETRRDKADFAEFSGEDIKYTYCTEFIVALEQPAKKDPLSLRAYLGALGDSLVFVDDETIIKVHVHTNNPGKALEEALTYGSLDTVKIENMRQQHTEQVLNTQPSTPAPAPPESRYGFVSVCSGSGIVAVMKDLGVASFVEGGQTMNPSTEDILAAVNATPASIVYVLPNNKNVIMAAEQCAGLSEKEIVVLPSKSIPQGVSALLAFDSSAEPDVNKEAMLGAMSSVKTGQVTSAARDSRFAGEDIREGDFMALIDGKLHSTHTDIYESLAALADVMREGEPAYVTVFFGEDVEENDARNAAAIFRRSCPTAEVTLLSGGQPIYHYLVSAE